MTKAYRERLRMRPPCGVKCLVCLVLAALNVVLVGLIAARLILR
jgi:hypothetical protein